MCRTPSRLCAVLDHFLWQRFFHDYWVIVLCTCHFMTMDEAFSFVKLFLRFGRTVTHLGGRGKPEKVLGNNLFMGGLNPCLSSEGQCLSRAQLHHSSSRNLSLGIQLHCGSCYLFPARTIVLPWAAPRDPSWA